MAKLEYKNGCIECNECGRLFDVPLPGDVPELVCPCGNSESLDALDLVTDTFNREREGDDFLAIPITPADVKPRKAKD
jgi:hypothetical protein